MNKQRRKEIENELIKLNDIKEALNMIMDEEQECFDNMPENLQYSERGSQSEEAIDCLQESIDSIDEIIDCLNDII